MEGVARERRSRLIQQSRRRGKPRGQKAKSRDIMMTAMSGYQAGRKLDSEERTLALGL
jgi:hypothetical protein